MNKQKLPSAWQPGDIANVVFPDNAILRDGKIFKVAFSEYGEPLYDVDIPFNHNDFDGEPEKGAPLKTGYFRLHGVRQWFLSYTQGEWDKMRAEEKAAG